MVGTKSIDSKRRDLEIRNWIDAVLLSVVVCHIYHFQNYVSVSLFGISQSNMQLTNAMKMQHQHSIRSPLLQFNKKRQQKKHSGLRFHISR